MVDTSKIQKEAKEILDKFASAIEKVEKEKHEIVFVDREDFEREEGNGKRCENFKEKLLANAPRSDGDFIITEKGAWK